VPCKTPRCVGSPPSTRFGKAGSIQFRLPRPEPAVFAFSNPTSVTRSTDPTMKCRPPACPACGTASAAVTYADFSLQPPRTGHQQNAPTSKPQPDGRSLVVLNLPVATDGSLAETRLTDWGQLPPGWVQGSNTGNDVSAPEPFENPTWTQGRVWPQSNHVPAETSCAPPPGVPAPGPMLLGFQVHGQTKNRESRFRAKTPGKVTQPRPSAANRCTARLRPQWQEVPPCRAHPGQLAAPTRLPSPAVNFTARCLAVKNEPPECSRTRSPGSPSTHLRTSVHNPRPR